MINEDLIVAKCIKNIDPWNDENIGLEIGKHYVVEEIYIGQSNSSVKIKGKFYNSILFEYYDEYLQKFDIYHSRYSPYWKSGTLKRGEK